MKKKRNYVYLGFEKQKKAKNKKTETWNILNDENEVVGSIHWRFEWNKYIFNTDGYECEFSAPCLLEVVNFLKEVNEKHKKKRKKKKGK